MEHRLLDLTPDHRPAIDALWQDCFPDDTPADRELLLDLLLTQGQGLAFGHDDCLQCMLFCLPAVFWDCGRTWPVAYVYAVGTHPTHRRQGLAAALLRAAHDCMRAAGFCACFLHPASPDLQAYYERLEYVPFLVQENVSTIGCAQATSLTFCSVQEYAARRTEVLTALAVPHIRWEMPMLDTACRLAGMAGGGPLGGEGFFGLVEACEETAIRLSEGGYLPACADTFTQVVSARAGAFSGGTLRGALPATRGNGVPVGWWYSLNAAGAAVYAHATGRRPFMGLTLA